MRSSDGHGIGSILIVDDEIHIGIPLGDFLRKNGYDATALTDGQEALQQVQRTEFSMLLLDINMPNVSGLDLARAALMRNPGTRIVFLTGELDSADARLKLAEFPNAVVLRKPFDLKNLLALIKNECVRE